MIPSWPHFAHGPHESAYPQLWTGLVGAWVPALGVQGLTLFDVSGSEQHGILTNMSLPADWVVDSGVPALSFDGTDAFVNAGARTSLDMGTDDYTVSVWIKAQDPTGSYGIILRSGAGSGTEDGVWFSINGTTGILEVWVSNGTTNVVNGFANTTDLRDNLWHNVVWVWDRNVGNKYYVDGTEVATNSVTNSDNITSDLNFQIGGHLGTLGFKGLLGHFYLYKHVLTPAEVKILYHEPLAPFMLRPRRALGLQEQIPVLHSSSSPWSQRGQFGPLLAH